MILWCVNSRRGLTELNKMCASASDKKKRVSIENGKNLKELEKKMKKILILINDVMFVFELVSQVTILALFEFHIHFQHQFMPNKHKCDRHITCLIC